MDGITAEEEDAVGHTGTVEIADHIGRDEIHQRSHASDVIS